MYNTRQVKRTRKKCRCSWCNEDILPGEPSVQMCGVHECDFWYCRMHPECCEADKRWWALHRDAEEAPGIMPRGSEFRRRREPI